MADALDFEASNRKCSACGETGHNARTCKSKTIPFSTGGFWREKTFDGLEQLGLPLVDGSHVAMISKIVDGEVLKEPNSNVAIPRIKWDEEPITMTRGELDEMCKAGDLISIGESRYSCSYLRGALAYLPKDTVLTCYTGFHYPLKATFEYGGEEWILFLAPRVENWYAETFEAVVVNRGPPPKGAVAKTMMNHAMMEKAKIEEMIHELENKVRLGIISEDQLMKHLEKKFGADYEITISDEDMEKIAKSQGRTKEELETYWEQYENTTDVVVEDYYEEFKRKHPEMHEKFVDRLSREDYWYGDYKTNLFAKRKELKEMGLDFDMIDRYWEMNDESIPERVTCSACNGEGIIITKYYPATRYDPADADYETCEMCDGEGTYLDGEFEAEGSLVDWEGKKENEIVSCPNCKWEGLESDLHYANQRYSCPECKRIDWKYIEFEAEIDDGMVEYMKTAVNSAKGSLEGLENEFDSMTAPRLQTKARKYTKGIKGNLEFLDERLKDSFYAETKKRKTGFRKCSKCGYSDHNSSNCNRLDEYEAYRKHKDEMLKECDDAIQSFTKKAKRYSEDGEYGLAKMLRSDATDMKKLKRMIENNHFGKAVHFAMTMDSDPRESAPSALWMFDAEEVKLSKTSCCCGATESNPCACMKAPEPMNCSATEPKCQCYKDLEKNAEYDDDYDPCEECGVHLGDYYVCPYCYPEEFEELDAETFEAKGKGKSILEVFSDNNAVLEGIWGGKDEWERNYGHGEVESFLIEFSPNMKSCELVLLRNLGKHGNAIEKEGFFLCGLVDFKDENIWSWVQKGLYENPMWEEMQKLNSEDDSPLFKTMLKTYEKKLEEIGFKNPRMDYYQEEGAFEMKFDSYTPVDFTSYEWGDVYVKDISEDGVTFQQQCLISGITRRGYSDVKLEWGNPRFRAESYNAEEKGKRKIGETVAWNNSIIGMDGKWRDGKYDLYEIGNQIGYVIVHQDIDNFEHELLEKGVLLGSKGTDIAQISFAGLNIYTGSDGSFPVVGLYEDIEDYYSRTQNKPKPIRDDWEEIEDYEKSRYLEQKWKNEFTEWAKTTYDFEYEYDDDYWYVKRELQKNHKLLVGARISISNPSMPNLEQRDSKSSVWLLEYPNLKNLTQGQYRGIVRGSNDVFINTEKTVDKIFANLQKKYPQGMISESDRGWRRTKSFSMIIPDFGKYTWTAIERKLVYDSLSDEEKKRKERLERAKRNKEYEQQRKEKQKALKEKYGAEYVQIGTMQSIPADGYNGYMKMMRDARSLVEIGNKTGLNQKLGEAYQDETGRWFLPILQKDAEESGFKIYYLVEMPQRDYLDNFPTLEDAQFAWKELPHNENFIIVERNPMTNKEKEMPRFGAEEGDNCPNCHCEHQNLSLDGMPDVDEEYVSVNVVCDDCGMKGYTTTYPYEWDNEAKLEDVGLPLAVNMYNPNYGELRCSRCRERFEKSAENYVLDVE